MFINFQVKFYEERKNGYPNIVELSVENHDHCGRCGAGVVISDAQQESCNQCDGIGGDVSFL